MIISQGLMKIRIIYKLQRKMKKLSNILLICIINVPHAHMTIIENMMTLNLWHDRLSHQGYAMMKRIHIS